MSGFPIEGIQGTITSITGATDLSTILDPTTGAIIPHTITVNERADELDITSQGSTSGEFRNGLITWDAQIVANYPFVQRTIGATGLITLGGTTLALVKSYDLTVESGIRDITAQRATGSDVDYRVFASSKKVMWGGSAECMVESGTVVRALTASSVALASYPAIVLKILEEGTDPTLSGTCMLAQRGHSIPIGTSGNQIVNLSFKGTSTLTAVSGSTTAAVFPAGAVDQPDWDTTGDGVPDVQIVVTAATGRTYTGMVFWRRVNIRCAVDGLIQVTVDLQGTGALARA